MKNFDLNSSIRVHNKRLDAWFVVSKGHVYDEITGIQIDKYSAIAIGAKKIVYDILNEAIEDFRQNMFISGSDIESPMKTYYKCIKALNI